MKQIKVLLWFDVEDYLTAESDDAFYDILRILDEYGVRATLKFCTKKVELLQKKGRTDILEKLKRHELCFHTTEHSIHPAAHGIPGTLRVPGGDGRILPEGISGLFEAGGAYRTASDELRPSGRGMGLSLIHISEPTRP